MTRLGRLCKLLSHFTLAAAVCAGLLLAQAPSVMAAGPVTIDIGSVSAGGDGYTCSGGVVTIIAGGDYTVTGTTTSNTLAVAPSIADVVNLTLSSVSMTNLSRSALAIGTGSTVDLALSGASVVSINNTASNIAGINVPTGATLRITGTGRLDVTGMGTVPGIGPAGAITIDSGTVNATGGYAEYQVGGSGIRGIITINGGTVTAKGGMAPNNGSGSGLAGTITINGGTVTAQAGEGMVGGAGIGGSGFEGGGTVTINGGVVTATGDMLNGERGAGIGGGYNCSGGTVVINGGTVIATGGNDAAGIGGGYGGSGGSVTITNQNSNTNVSAYGKSGGAGIGGGRSKNGNGGAGGTIIISGGTVTADSTGGYGGAGLGSGYVGTGATEITISGGTVHATGGYNSAGIGGAEQCSGGTINISGGDVTAQGGYQGAGIGCGCNPITNGGVKGGAITITGGTVNATGGDSGAGIGGGFNASGNTIEISGSASVTATGGPFGAGIGGGSNKSDDLDENGNGGTITIGGGEVTATGRNGGAGIGGGYMGNAGAITINGGRIIAAINSSTGGSPIGTGVNSGYLINKLGTNTVTINGGYVRASGGTYDIGGGSTCNSLPVTNTFNGGSIDISSFNKVPLSNTKTVYRTTITVMSADQTVLTDTGVTYQINGGSTITTVTDGAGKLYLWLPTAGSPTIQIFNGGTEYKAAGSITADNAAAMTAIEQTYTIDPLGNQTFADLTEGYANGTQETKTIRISNSGTATLTNLSVSMGTGEASSFSMGAPASTTLAPGAYTDITVKALAGLAAGSYTAHVIIKADKLTDMTFEATQTVQLVSVDFINSGAPFATLSVHCNASIGEADWPDNPEKTGYDFVGWFTNAGNQHFPDSVFTQDTTLTARWSAKHYSISYNHGGGTVSPANPTGYTIESSAITLTNPTKTGYQFAGWTAKDDAVPSIAVTIPTGSVGNLLFTAHWTASTYTIGYDLGGGTVSPANPTGYTIESSAITLTNPTKTGYQFAGWSSKDSAVPSTAVTIPAGSTGNLLFTAHWTANTYTIGYDLGGGTVSPANPTGYTIESSAITLTNPTKRGYQFAGWSGEDGATPSTAMTIPAGSVGNLLFTAYWTANTYTIGYDLGGGEVSPANPSAYSVESGDIVLRNPVKKGCTFDGWSGTDITGTSLGVTIPAGSVGNRTYAAHWTANTATVTFDSQGGTMVASATAICNTTITAPAAPARTGYTFSGWYKDAAYSSPWNFATEPVTGDITLFAKWAAQVKNANLSGISLSAGSLSKAFSPSVMSYTVNLGENDGAVTITPIKGYDGASMMIDKAKITKKVISIANGKTVTSKIVVKYGKATKTYTLTIKRAKSTNNTLATLTASAGTLSQAFNPAVTAYTLTLPEVVAKVKLKATKGSALATMTSASKAYTLRNGQTVKALIKVKAQSGASKTYTVTITRAKSTNTALSSLKTNGKQCPLTPAFGSGQTSYAVKLPAKTSSVTIACKAADKLASVSIDGAKRVSKKIALVNGQTVTVAITVLSQAGNTQTYTIAVSKP